MSVGHSIFCEYLIDRSTGTTSATSSPPASDTDGGISPPPDLLYQALLKIDHMNSALAQRFKEQEESDSKEAMSTQIDGPADESGLSRAEKRYAFRQRHPSISRRHPSPVETVAIPISNYETDEQQSHIEEIKRKSLVVIFGGNNVRRANRCRKVDARLQRYNHRQ